MNAILRFFLPCFLSLGFCSAQSAYFYTNVSSDGNNIYVSGTIQSNGWGNLYGVTHTYSQNLAISSPKGQAGGCSFSNPVSAGQSVYYQCEAQLSLYDGSGAFDAGDYIVSGRQTARCSVVGQFAAIALFTLVSGKISITGYRQNIFANGSEGYSYDPGACNCSCRAENGIYRAGNYPYWLIGKTVIVIFGVPLCIVSNNAKPYLLDQGRTYPVPCGDFTGYP
jgi:hypothetical protein